MQCPLTVTGICTSAEGGQANHLADRRELIFFTMPSLDKVRTDMLNRIPSCTTARLHRRSAAVFCLTRTTCSPVPKNSTEQSKNDCPPFRDVLFNKTFLVKQAGKLRAVIVERFPSGQREQTVNLSAKPSEVRILPSPPQFSM
jgi:hypothetical protein